MEKEIKHIYGERRAIKDDVEETRTIEFVISSGKKDRHGTRLLIDRWDLKNYDKNGIVGYQHNVYGGDMCNAPNPDDVIGEGKAWIEGEDLIGSIKFEPKELNPLAEKLFRKVLHGTLKSTSVGFSETVEGDYGKGDEARGKENETYIYGAQELLEFSIVNIPSNTDAIKRDLGNQVANAIMYLKRNLKGDYSFSDIENMTIRGAIDLLDGKVKKKTIEPKNEVTETQRRQMKLTLFYLAID